MAGPQSLCTLIYIIIDGLLSKYLYVRNFLYNQFHTSQYIIIRALRVSDLEIFAKYYALCTESEAEEY